jgi:hypothetical protein
MEGWPIAILIFLIKFDVLCCVLHGILSGEVK